MNDLDKIYWDAYDKGAKYVLEYLADVFEGVEDTDVWKDFFRDDKENND